MSDTAIQSMRRMLSGREAFRVAYSINPATGVESLARMWWCKYDQYQEAAKHLDLYTDAGNSEETEYVTAPNAGRSESFPGKWVHSGCSQSQEADKLIQSLTRVYEITTNAELFARDAIPTFDNNILNLFGHKESEGDALAVVIYALTKESRAFCMGIADAALTEGLIGGAFSYSGRRFDVDPETNSARLTVAFEKVAHNAFVVGSADLTWYSNKTTKQEQKHQLWMLVNKADALVGLYTPDSGYQLVTTVSLSPSEKGSLTVQRTQVIEADDVTNVKQIDAFGTTDADTDQNKTTPIVEETAQTPGQIKQTRAQVNGNGLYDNTEDIKTATERANFAESASHNAFDKEATAKSRNLVAEPTLPDAQTPGQVKRLAKRLNDFLRWDSDETTQTAEVQAAAGAAKTVKKFVVEASTEARNLVEEPTLENTQTQGIIKTIQKRLNLFLRWDKQEQIRTATEVDGAQKSKQVSKFDVVVTNTDRNKVAAITEETTQTPGQIKQTRNSVNDFDLNDHDTQIRTATEVDGARASKQITKYETATTNVDRNKAAAITDETIQTAGKIKQTRNTVNDYDLNDHETQERVATEVNDSRKTKQISTFETVATGVDRNKPTPIAEETTQTTGQIKQTRNTVNDYDLNDHETQLRTATEVDGTVASGQKTAAETVTTTANRNKAAAATFGALVPGQIEDLSSKLNEFLLWDTQRTLRESIDQTSTDQSAGHLSTSEVTRHTHKVAAEVAGTPGTGEQVSVSSRPTPFGDFQTSRNVDTAVEITGADYGKTALGEIQTAKTWNGNKITTAPTRAAGTTVTQAQSPTPFKDKWNIVVATDTGTPWDTGWLEINNPNGATFFRRWGNQSAAFHDAIIAAFTDSTSNSINPSYNRYGLWDGSATKRTTNNGDGTFFRSTDENVVVDELETRRILKWESASGLKLYRDQSRTRTVKYKSVIVQTYGVADTTKRQYTAVPNPQTKLLRIPKITGVSDGGNRGWLVDVWYESYGEWTDVP